MRGDWRPLAQHTTLERRARLLADIRAFMAAGGVLEVATPLLAEAAPVERGLDCFRLPGAGYLVPSPEHGLKRLLAAHAGAVYQLGPVFRAGEAGRWHNPEFWMLEWYRPQASMADAVTDTQALLAAVAGVPAAAARSYRDVFYGATGVDPMAASAAQLAAYARAQGIAPDASDEGDRAFWLDLIMSLVVQPTLGMDAPLCVTGFPADDAVLVQTDTHDARIAQRFECFWRGVELANGAQELTDAQAARTRMQREQQTRAARGQPVPALDERLLAAMESGLPSCAGVALGVDRLLALMLGFDGIAKTLTFGWARR